MANPFVGTIIQVGFNFPPIGWAFCDGQLLPIANYNALFALIGTTYGGDGVTTFALPNMQSRKAIAQGTGPGLSTYVMGQLSGTESTTLLTTQMPQHSHGAAFNNTSGIPAATGNASLAAPAAGSRLAKAIDTDASPDLVPQIYAPAGSPNPVELAQIDGTGTVALAPAGGNQPFAHQPPYLTLNFIIALEGVFPSRN